MKPEPVVFENCDAFKKMTGKALPDSGWIQVSQQMINDFANATLDKQWVHVDTERAAIESPFKKTIAHGFMSVALLSKFLGDVMHIKSLTMGLNYGMNSVRFMNPIPVDSQIRLKSTVKEVTLQKNGYKATFSCTVEIRGVEKPACVAEFLALFIE